MEKIIVSRDNICDKVFKNGPSKICERQPLKNLKGYGLLKHLCLVKYLIKYDLKTPSNAQVS